MAGGTTTHGWCRLECPRLGRRRMGTHAVWVAVCRVDIGRLTKQCVARWPDHGYLCVRQRCIDDVRRVVVVADEPASIWPLGHACRWLGVDVVIAVVRFAGIGIRVRAAVVVLVLRKNLATATSTVTLPVTAAAALTTVPAATIVGLRLPAAASANQAKLSRWSA